MDFFKSFLCPTSPTLLPVLVLAAPVLVAELVTLVLDVILESDETCRFNKLVLLLEVLNKWEGGCVCVFCNEFELWSNLAFEAGNE